MKNLVLVPGHAIPYRFDRLAADEGWFLKPFQAGEGRFYLEHLLHGVLQTAADGEALLIFAGGYSDGAAGPRSEAQGYWLAADYHAWAGHREVRQRTTTEEFSCDSYQNLLFGICRFHEFAGGYPERITVVGWGFKAARFHFHCETVRFPRERFQYQGINDPDRLEEARGFECRRLEDFKRDPYGSRDPIAAKRIDRNPFRRQHGYYQSCPDLAALLQYEGPHLFDTALPW